MYQNFIYLFTFWPCPMSYGILVPRPGIEPKPQQWERGVLTTGLQGNSLKIYKMQYWRWQSNIIKVLKEKNG